MKNSVIFLGTSHGDPTLTRFCSSTLYRLGDCSLLIDAGEPVTGLLVREGIQPSSLDAVFLSHMHIDHVGGLPALVHYLMKYPDDSRQTELLFPEESAVEDFRNWMNAAKAYIRQEKVCYTGLNPDFIWNKKGVRVSCIPTEHIKAINAPSYAFLLETDSCRILHTGDLTGDFHDFPEIDPEKPLDLCVCEATHVGYRLEAFLERIAKFPIKQFVFNHIGPLWTDGKEKILEDAVSGLPFPVLVARDGSKLEL